MTTASEILDFWFAADAREKWFKTDPKFDAEIKKRFTAAYEDAAAGKLASWEDDPAGRVALIVLLDQFPRNMFRGSAQAYATDEAALRIARKAIGAGVSDIPKTWQHTIGMPLMHSESLPVQDEGMAYFRDVGEESSLKYMERHRSVIEQFGRFAHRNDVLGRQSTPEERDFLKTHERGF